MLFGKSAIALGEGKDEFAAWDVAVTGKEPVTDDVRQTTPIVTFGVENLNLSVGERDGITFVKHNDVFSVVLEVADIYLS